MKHLALIIVAVLGTSVAVFAQDGTKKQEPKKIESKKLEQRTPARKQVSVQKKTEIPAEKMKKQ